RCRHVNGRLVVTLRPVPAEQQPLLQREPVFDRPEVELGIVSAPGAEPWVAEVIFPASTSIAEAKDFLRRELQELAVHAAGPAARWHEGDGAVALELSAAAEAPTVFVPLDEGFRECVGRCAGAGEVSWQTARLEFDRSAGWDRERAERWAEERLGLRD